MRLDAPTTAMRGGTLRAITPPPRDGTP
jgi:hypothetical protein